ncbi:MAG: hypothetical protein V4695_04990 [Pseudomonadota bacterium]
MTNDLTYPDVARRPVFITLSILIFGTIVSYALLLPLQSADINEFLLPWFKVIDERGFAAMSGEYANYTPPYLYLLGIASLLSGIIAPIYLIKSVGIVFTLFGALIFSRIVFDITHNKRRALIAGFAFPLIPSVAINAAWWGQCDAIYTSFLLCAFLASLRKKPFLVMVFFSVAFSFKAQAIFFSPFLLFLLLNKEMPWKYLGIIPVVYAVLMLPAWLAGRGVVELATIYLNQGNYYRSLSMNSPNLWAVVTQFDLLSYRAGLVFGIAAAVVGNLWLIVKAGVKSKTGTGTDSEPWSRTSIYLVLAGATLLLSPYLLPKMHDRYFFPADVFLILLAALRSRFVIAAGAMQAASVIVALGFLGLISRSYAIPSMAGALLTTIAVIVVCRPLLSGARPLD